MTASIPRDDIETALRAELRARTASLAAGEAPLARIETASRRGRVRRRTLFGTAFVLAAVLAAVPALVGALGSGTGPAAGGQGTGNRDTPLFSIPPRGNLLGDAAFIQAVTGQYFAHASLLYANDDGTHTVVIGVADESPPAYLAGNVSDARQFTVLVGPHDAQAGQLTQAAQEIDPAGPAASYTFVGDFDGTGRLVPYVVLGPTNLTKVEYATGIKLRDEDGKLTPVRTGVTSAAVMDGAAAGEIQDSTDVDAAFRLSLLTAWRGSTSNGTVLTLDPSQRTAGAAAEYDRFLSPPYTAIREAVVHQAHQDGITVDEDESGGDEITDLAAEVLFDLMVVANVDPGSISYSVDWVGRDTTQWDSALIEFDAPGLPKIQALILGLAPGQPFPGLSGAIDQAFVRPAVPLTPGHLPATAAQFGGTPENTTIGSWLTTHW